MNGTFQLIRRARREGISLRPPQTCETSGVVAPVRAAQADPARIDGLDEPLRTGSIYRELMQKYDSVRSRHLG